VRARGMPGFLRFLRRLHLYMPFVDTLEHHR
jgi:hypothetical protein